MKNIGVRWLSRLSSCINTSHVILRCTFRSVHSMHYDQRWGHSSPCMEVWCDSGTPGVVEPVSLISVLEERLSVYPTDLLAWSKPQTPTAVNECWVTVIKKKSRTRGRKTTPRQLAAWTCLQPNHQPLASDGVLLSVLWSRIDLPIVVKQCSRISLSPCFPSASRLYAGIHAHMHSSSDTDQNIVLTLNPITVRVKKDSYPIKLHRLCVSSVFLCRTNAFTHTLYGCVWSFLQRVWCPAVIASHTWP